MRLCTLDGITPGKATVLLCLTDHRHVAQEATVCTRPNDACGSALQIASLMNAPERRKETVETQRTRGKGACLAASRDAHETLVSRRYRRPRQLVRGVGLHCIAGEHTLMKRLIARGG